MIGIFFLPYQDIEVYHGCDAENIDAVEYSKMIIKDDFKYKDQVNHMMRTRFANNMSDNEYEKWKRKYISQKTGFLPCRCRLMDKNGANISNVDLMNESQSNKANIFIIQLDMKEFEEDELLNREFTSWILQTKKIWNCNKIDEKTKITNLPIKDFRLKTDDGNLILLKNTKFIENKGNKTSFAILVERIIYMVKSDINNMEIISK